MAKTVCRSADSCKTAPGLVSRDDGEGAALSDIPADAGKPDDVRRALALLNAAGARMGNSLDLERTARELLDIAVPQFCDLASVDLYEEVLAGDDPHQGSGEGSAPLRRVAFASAVGDGSDPDTVPLGSTHRYAFESPCAAALRTARVKSVHPVENRDGESVSAFGIVVHSTLAVPMIAGERVLGLVQFSRAKGSERFGDRDAALAAELAARAAVCIDNARLYRREHERALILQRSLLPPGNPEAAGLDIACRYRPGAAATEVGGDWFDVIGLPGHRTALVVGDVMGRGLRAAVAMGELRTAVRTLALLDLEPAEVLEALDEIARGLGDTRYSRREDGDLAEVYLATCVYAVYDPVSRRCTIANAGHLPPVLVEPGRALGDVPAPVLLADVPKGVPLGVGGEPFEQIEIQLPDGALLALYTDGLVESRHQSLDVGLETFRSTLGDSNRPLEEVCDRVFAGIDADGEDDMALLLARVHGLPGSAVGDWRLPAEPRSVARARELARAQLAEWDLGALTDTTELLVSELVTNALRHGAGTIRLRLLFDHCLVCEVWDSGQVQPRRRRAQDTDEGGRGLQLVELLSARWGSRRTPAGKAVWFELKQPKTASSREVDPVQALLDAYPAL
ncbi:serine/threonine-protein phosphatase [Streptomyces sp. OF3]|uniref:Serine/threonine-protein phosphatase n=1 Tax=Streptomyces alkaliterrae TaxID=2213162 RepID=A0A7W3ZMP2_9ACTN|nr:serine/threonine-protein phosphatase [Streptomyces alkaliterrae]